MQITIRYIDSDYLILSTTMPTIDISKITAGFPYLIVDSILGLPIYESSRNYTSNSRPITYRLSRISTMENIDSSELPYPKFSITPYPQFFSQPLIIQEFHGPIRLIPPRIGSNKRMLHTTRPPYYSKSTRSSIRPSRNSSQEPPKRNIIVYFIIALLDTPTS